MFDAKNEEGVAADPRDALDVPTVPAKLIEIETNAPLAIAQASKLSAALSLAARGFRVFRLHPNSKLPVERGWTSNATTDPKTIRTWWTDPVTEAERDFNIAIQTNDLVVLDVDVKADKCGFTTMLELGLDVFDTLVVRTSTNGYHLIYSGPGFEVGQSPLGKDIDIRSHNGFIVAPGSTLDVLYDKDDRPLGWVGGFTRIKIAEHIATGATIRYAQPYVVEFDQPVIDFPARLVGRLKPPGVRAEKQAISGFKEDKPANVETARHWLRHNARLSVEGSNGNDAAYVVACNMRDRGLSEITAWELMLDEWNERCLPPWHPDELKVVVAHAFTYAKGPAGAKTIEAAFSRVTPISAPPHPPAPAPARDDGTFTAASLRDRQFAPLRYVAEPYIAEGLSLLVGAPKLGKSWFVLDIAVAKASGTPCLGGVSTGEAGDVLHLALEDNERRLQDRLAKLLPFGQPWPARLTFATTWPRIDQGAADRIRQWADGCQAPALVIIDVLAMLRPPGNRTDSSYAQDYAPIKEMQALAAELNIAIVVVHHTRKARDSVDPFDRVSGTLGLSGAADAVLILDRGTNGVTLYGRGREIAEFEEAVAFDKTTCRWSVVGRASEVHVSDARKGILDALAVTLEGGAVTLDALSPSDIAARTSSALGATKRLLFKMLQDGKVVRKGYGRYTLPAAERRS